MYKRTVNNNSAHNKQYINIYDTTMYNSIMPNIDIIANFSTITLISTMNSYIILYIAVISYFYVIHISPYHSIEPYRTMFSNAYITYDSTIRSYKSMLINKRKAFFYR